MIKTILLPLLLITLFTGCSSLKVATDFDPNIKMQAPKNFHIVHKDDVNEDSLTSARIISAIMKEMKDQGYQHVSKEKADFFILFHTGVTTKSRVVTDYKYVNMYPYSYGYGFGYGYSAVAVPESRNYTYKVAQLIVDAVLPQKNRIFWRGTANDMLQKLDTPDERTDYIDDVVSKLLKSFPQ